MKSSISAAALGVTLSAAGFAGDNVGELETPRTKATHAPSVVATRVLQNDDFSKVVLTQQIAGVALIQGSSAHGSLQELAGFWNRGAIAPVDKVISLLTAARLEPGTDIQPTRMRTILQQHPSDEVRLAALKFMHEAKLVLVSDETLRQFWKSSNPEVISYALLCRSKDIGRATSPEFITPYLSHSEISVRSAAVIAGIAAKQKIPDGPGSAEAFIASRFLTADQFSAGFEARLARLMSDSLVKRVGDVALKGEIPLLAVSVMHLLQRIDDASPGYLDSVVKMGPEAFDEFCIACAAFLQEKRNEVREKVILNKESPGLVALHFEVSFSSEPASDLFSAVKAQAPRLIKAGVLPNGEAGFAEGELTVYPDTPTRRLYFKELDSYRSSKPKEEYLRALAEVTADRTKPCVVWHMMHGGPKHSWFYHGTPGTQNAPDQMRHPHAVSFVEMAQVLFETQMKRPQDASALSFGHVTIILDACQQYTMAEGVLRELDRLAARAGSTIESFPTITTLSQPLMYGYMNIAVVERALASGATPQEKAQIADALVSPLFSHLVKRSSVTAQLTVGDLLEGELKAVNGFNRLIEDPTRLSTNAGGAVKASEEADGRGLRLLNGQDPTVFSPAPCALKDVLEYVQGELLKREIALPEVPRGDRITRPTFLEISSSVRKTESTTA